MSNANGLPTLQCNPILLAEALEAYSTAHTLKPDLGLRPSRPARILGAKPGTASPKPKLPLPGQAVGRIAYAQDKNRKTSGETEYLRRPEFL